MIIKHLVPKRIKDFSFYIDLFAKFCYKNCYIMTPEDSKLIDVKENIISVMCFDLVPQETQY